MDTTSLKLGDSYAECKADAARYVPTIGLYLPKERSDYLHLTPSISHEQTRDAARYVPTGWCSQVLCFT